MKKQLLIYGITCSLLPMFGYATCSDAPCPTNRVPCGVEEVISCATENYNKTHPGASFCNVDFYNTMLFASGTQDGFCEYKTETSSYPPGVTAGTGTQTYYDNYCNSETGTYFSYANFIAASQVLNYSAQPAFGGQGGFACAASADQSIQEVAAFFSSIAQETTTGITHTNDGLYYRYENQSIKNKNNTPCSSDLSQCIPGYYPEYTGTTQSPGDWVGVTNYVAHTSPLNTTTYTPYLWALATGTPPASAYYPQYEIAQSPMNLLTPLPQIPLVQSGTTSTCGTPPQSQICVASSNTVQQVATINDPSVLDPGMWVGMGSMQLTGSSMYYFYGWYDNNIATGAPVLTDNYATFVNNFLKQGQRSFEGGFWYWMYRTIGKYYDVNKMYPTIHQLMIDSTRPACHCIGAVTVMVNGGCGDFETRKEYYNYFTSSDVLNLNPAYTQCVQQVVINGQKVTINGAQCGLDPVTKTTLDVPTQNLKTYCQSPV